MERDVFSSQPAQDEQHQKAPERRRQVTTQRRVQPTGAAGFRRQLLVFDHLVGQDVVGF